MSQTSAVEGESVVEIRADQAGVEVITLAARPRLRGSGHSLFIRRYDEDRVFAISEWVSFGAERVSINGNFTDEQLSDIRNVIKHSGDPMSAEPIMSIFWSAQEVHVMTGVQRGPLDGCGHAVILEQRDGRWSIVSARAWVS